MYIYIFLFRMTDNMTSGYTLYNLDIDHVVKQLTKVMNGVSQERATKLYP
jgi:hypothetical protein